MDALSKDELRSLLWHARQARERDFMMILVAYWHGLRASELVELKRDDIHDGMITVQRKKGSERTTQPLISDPDPLFDERQALLKWVEFIPESMRIFPVGRKQFWTLFQRYAQAAGIPKHKRHPHTLKHSIAMHTIGSAGVQNVRRYLGHKSGGSTLEYLKVNDEEASAAIERAIHPSKDH